MLKVFILKKVVLEVLVSRMLITKILLFALKMIDLDTEISIKKTIMVLVFEINGGGIYMEITLIY